MKTKKQKSKQSIPRNELEGLVTGGMKAMGKYGGLTIGYSSKLLSRTKKSLKEVKLPRGMSIKDLVGRRRAEEDALRHKIDKIRKEIARTYHEIGKESAKLPGIKDILEHDKIMGMISYVKALEEQIADYLKRIEEIAISPRMDVYQAMEKAIDQAIKKTKFKTTSDKVVFEKVANDLLDEEIEIRMFAVAEIGRLGNPAAIAILKETLEHDGFYINSEIINSLIDLGGPEAIPIFKERARDKDFKVRLGCLRGLYQMSGQQSVPYLIQALMDSKKVVKKSAVTFLGRLGNQEAVLPLIRALDDKNRKIREEIVYALESIIGDKIAFDLDLKGKERGEAIENLERWWQEQRKAELETMSKSALQAESDRLGLNYKEKETKQELIEKILKKERGK